MSSNVTSLLRRGLTKQRESLKARAELGSRPQFDKDDHSVCFDSVCHREEAACSNMAKKKQAREKGEGQSPDEGLKATF